MQAMLADVRAELAAELRELDDRLRDLEAVLHIEDLHRGFTRAVADRRFGTLAECFTDDAVIDMRTHGEKHGRDAIKHHFDGMSSVPLVGAGWLLSSPVLQVAGDCATGEWTWHRFVADGSVAGRPARVWGVWEEGRYRCSYRRTLHGWRFARMWVRVVRPDHDDAPGGGE